MSFKQINQLAQYANEDYFEYVFERGGKYFLQRIDGEIEIDSTTYNALKTGKPVINSIYYVFTDIIKRVKSVKISDDAVTTEQTAGESALTFAVVVATFKSKVSSSTTPVEFTYDGTNTAWKIGETTADLTQYGITVTGTPADADKFKATFVPAVYGGTIEFNNGMKIEASSGVDSIVANGFYSLNGEYYNQDKIVKAYTDGTNYSAKLINGDVIAITSTEYTAITTGANTPFAKIYDDGNGKVIYFNSYRLFKLFTSNSKYYIEMPNGTQLEITATIYGALDDDCTFVNGVGYFYLDDIARGFTRNSKYYIVFPNGIELEIQGVSGGSTAQQIYESIFTNQNGFHALSLYSYYNDIDILKVFRVGPSTNYQYFAEFGTGYQVEITEAQYSSFIPAP